MQFLGPLQKMKTMPENPVRYALRLNDDLLAMNQLIGRELQFVFTGSCICSSCGKISDRFYRNSFCYECFFSKPQAGEAIFRPELSKAHLGIEDRDLEFEKGYQLQPHVVYLANSGGLKVGVTRARQKQTRWMDQGASAAIVFAETENRYQAGLIEVAMKEHLSDKTPWQRMVKGQIDEIDLVAQKQALLKNLNDDQLQFASKDDSVYTFDYPVEAYPQKVKSVNLSKQKEHTGMLTGIKGQYLLFEEGQVMNVRSHEGYVVELDVR
jgi:hypothetical protein